MPSRTCTSADGDDARPAFELPAFERAVVDVHLLRLLADLAAVFGIVDDQIGVAAQGDRALAREQAEELGGLRAAGVDERVQVDAAALDAVGVDEIHAIFDAGNAVGDLGEIVAAHFLLAVEVERRMIGGDRADHRATRVRSRWRPGCALRA